MFKTKSRSCEKEYIDIGSSCYTLEEYSHSLHQLSRIGHWLGGDTATFSAFDQLDQAPSSILDVGCGGGRFTRKLAEYYPQAQVRGIDISPEAIEYANEKLDQHNQVTFLFPSSRN